MVCIPFLCFPWISHDTLLVELLEKEVLKESRSCPEQTRFFSPKNTGMSWPKLTFLGPTCFT